MGFKEILDIVQKWIAGLIDFGLGVALIFLVVDLLFGPTTNIVPHVTELIREFTSQGIVGLIALLVFTAIYYGYYQKHQE